MITTLHGDCREQLQTLPAGSVQCIVTSPPYYGLRRYSDDPREIGQEATPDCMAWARHEPPCGDCYVCALRAVFAQAWRVLREDGVAWVNLGDSYTRNGGTQGGGNREMLHMEGKQTRMTRIPEGAPVEKNLLGIPWRVAFALQADGWYLRSDVIWNKPNCMPESVTDRPTRAHEYVFLLSKSARYFYDSAAIEEESAPSSKARAKYNGGAPSPKAIQGTADGVFCGPPTTGRAYGQGRNKRTVWEVATQPFKGSHYATMPEALIAPCILAGSSAQACETCGAAWGRVVEKDSKEGPDRDVDQAMIAGPMSRTSKAGANHSQFVKSRMGDSSVSTLGFAPRCACAANTGSARSVVLDPFAGSGTVQRVATRYQRDAIGIELNADYITDHIETRTDGVQVELFV